MEPGFWLWLILGFVLVGAEVMMPGAFLLWPGIAALLTGMVAYSMPGLGWQALAVLFAVLTVASALLGRRAYGHFRQPVEVALNRRAHMLVGSAHVLSTPILDGAGRLSLGGTTWTVNGPDLPTGARVRIVGVDGAVLKVEKIEA